jgi:NAD(P)-dependent dehydrogenase (short-subunit alcohol dehydrogenase family)
MTIKSLKGKTILVTGSARRVGRELALAVARAGAEVVLHHAHSDIEAEQTAEEVRSFGVKCAVLKADLTDLDQAQELISRTSQSKPLFAIVNNAAVYDPLMWGEVTIDNWQAHLNLNLGSPFFLAQAFSRSLLPDGKGRIVNILDWRALRPGADHLPYMISKSGLVALTRSLAIALAPRITVNGIALGAILPPSDGAFSPNILKLIPSNRWAMVDEVSETLLFLLTGPEYITGEIIHVDGGRHLI